MIEGKIRIVRDGKEIRVPVLITEDQADRIWKFMTDNPGDRRIDLLLERPARVVAVSDGYERSANDYPAETPIRG